MNSHRINYHPSGTHIIVDCGGIQSEVARDGKALCEALRVAVMTAGATLMNLDRQEFTGGGVTAFAVLAESHASLHSYPEFGVVMIDVFTCGDCNPDQLVSVLLNHLQPSRVSKRQLTRGLDTSAEEVREPVGDGLTRVWQLKQILVKERTKFQQLIIADTEQGVSLFLDDSRQSTEKYQLQYHEAQFLPAAMLSRSCEKVLVIGSSEGVVSQLALECGAQEVVHVDLDERCTRLCALHLPYGYSPVDVENAHKGIGKTKLIFSDALVYVDKLIAEGKCFDIITIDVADEDESDRQHNSFYQKEFLEKAKKLCRQDGCVISQAGCSTAWRNASLKRVYEQFTKVFATTVPFELTENDWVWMVGCPQVIQDPTGRMLQRLPELPYKAKHIDGETVRAAVIPTKSLREFSVSLAVDSGK